MVTVRVIDIEGDTWGLMKSGARLYVLRDAEKKIRLGSILELKSVLDRDWKIGDEFEIVWDDELGKSN